MTKRAAVSASPSPAAPADNFVVALAELEQKLVEVRSRREAVIAERLIREGNGEHLAKPLAAADQDQQAQALRLLNGAASGRAVVPERQAYRALLTEQATLDRALAIGNTLWTELRLKARAALGAERADEHKALMHQLAIGVIALERTSTRCALAQTYKATRSRSGASPTRRAPPTDFLSKPRGTTG
jgi:hypothetical protein